ncbi:AAA family ATPase [Geminocystis sp. GBBB08]|uniref:AAA family ATPase n=1 Tax=Geminocystis sp. GBBB08 TaxID=2604140 RepID=UPI0027E34C32|nr:AAA family ATPase [Geminocystis sp. GBBB08]MBL1208746.1 AAA family ATPase [Geminocystis sp. GBBB08]
MINLPDYQIISKIYDSVNSEVYNAVGKIDQKKVILKVLKQDYPTPNELIRYRQEYQLTNSLNIDGVIKAYSLEKYQNSLLIVLEDFGGKSWKNLAEKQSFNLEKLLSIAIKVTASLGQIHKTNIIHKDINPSNIVINLETEEVKIIDFGISTKLTRENPTFKSPNILEGTLAYISPEQTGRMNCSIDYRTDFYSLGVTFYEMFTGKLPFNTEDDLELVHCHIAKLPLFPTAINSLIPPIISNIIMKLMAKNVEDRYQSAWGLKADLENCLQRLQTTGKIEDFELATHDISDKFQISQKLYGRETEIEILLKAFEGVNGAELMLIGGYSGIGKTALVKEIYKPISAKKGYFLSGKFDQFQRNIPYSAIVNAFRGLIKQLLTETENKLKQWQDKLLAVLGINGKVIAEVIPEIELIIGKQPDLIELGAIEAQNRFNLVFQKFINVFTQPQHPLVIFLDDLQWADNASLKLLQMLITQNLSGLFVIGAYRDNEVFLSHPLMLTLDEIAKTGAIINQVFLSPLNLSDIAQLIGDSINYPFTEVQDLAELVEIKTGGNPFFVNQFLKSIYTEKFLQFDYQYLRWRWDLSQIKERGFTDNVVEFMTTIIQKLPQDTQELLKIASCIGNQFNVQVLGVIINQSLTKTVDILEFAVAEGLVTFLESREEVDLALIKTDYILPQYKFIHDRIQQAAYSLISEKEKSAFHLKIGQILLENYSEKERDEKIFDIVEHFNLSRELITEQNQKNQLAQLNLIAGQKAKKSIAHIAAMEYLNIGIELLPQNSWQTEYDLTLALYLEATEVSYLKGDFSQMETLGESVINNSNNLLDKIGVYETKLQAYSVMNRFLDGIKLGLFCLQLLGIELPENSDENIIIAWQERTQTQLDHYSLQELIDLPKMTDKAMLSAMRILTRMTPLSYFCNPNLFPLISCQGVLISLKYGHSDETPNSYACYALILCSPGVDQFSRGYQYGMVATNLLEKQNNQRCRAIILNNVHALVTLWKKHHNDCIPPLKDAYKSGIEYGDLEFAGYAFTNILRLEKAAGKELSQLETDFKRAIEFTNSIKAEGTRQYTLANLQTVTNLRDSQTPWNLDGEIYHEKQALLFFTQTNNLLGLSIHYYSKLYLHYLFGYISEAMEDVLEGKKYIYSICGHNPLPQFVFFAALTHLLALEIASDSEKQYHQQQIENLQNRLKMWADNAPMNYLHKWYLVEAEKTRILGDKLQCIELYDSAIACAKEYEYLNEEALANELAGKFYLHWGKEKIANVYLVEAHYCYLRWGAITKVKHLEKEYPQFLATHSKKSHRTITTNATASDSHSNLDIATVMKASQAISGEIVLEKLLVSLMKIIIQNAGAQLGYLILENNHQLLIEAEGFMDNDNITALQSLPMENKLPVTLINYVARVKEDLVLNDANSQGNFINDSYIIAKKPKSILCTPLLNQGKLIGIVYLENNLTTSAFTEDRLEVIKLLSGQASIAIENAILYQTLEDKVKERTAQLASANQEIITLNEKLKIENLRLSAELNVAKKLQEMVLPKSEELEAISELDIAGYMSAVEEVGGDYYDVLKSESGVKITIGDVTGHGLESGVLMLMAQTAIRTLQKTNETDAVRFLDILNQTLYDNLQRMGSDKNMTLTVLDYTNNILKISGQHEEIILIRADGNIEKIDTLDLGFPLGLESEIAHFINEIKIKLNPEDLVILYSDGITEAENLNQQQYGLDNLCQIALQNRHKSAQEIQEKIINNVREFIGNQKIFDDITLVILKQKNNE